MTQLKITVRRRLVMQSLKALNTFFFRSAVSSFFSFACKIDSQFHSNLQTLIWLLDLLKQSKKRKTPPPGEERIEESIVPIRQPRLLPRPHLHNLIIKLHFSFSIIYILVPVCSSSCGSCGGSRLLTTFDKICHVSGIVSSMLKFRLLRSGRFPEHGLQDAAEGRISSSLPRGGLVVDGDGRLPEFEKLGTVLNFVPAYVIIECREVHTLCSISSTISFTSSISIFIDFLVVGFLP